MKRPLVVVFLPAHNEEACLPTMLIELNALKDDPALPFSIRTLLVDDGSRDGTIAAAQAGGIDAIRRHEVPRGLGAATRTALLYAWEAEADAAVKLDADGQYSVDDIAATVAPVLNETADLVFAVRAELAYRMPFVRRCGNRTFTWLMRRLTGFPIRDGQTGLIAFSRSFMNGFSLLGDYNPPQQLLLDAWRRRQRYAEVPIVVQARQGGESFVRWIYPFRVITNITRFYLSTRGFPAHSPARPRPEPPSV